MNGPEQLRGLRLVAGLLAAGWAMLTILLLVAMIRVPASFADAAALWSLVAGTAAVVGALATMRLRRWGVYLYVAAALSVTVKAFLFRTPEAPFEFSWWYAIMLLLFIGMVAANWGRMRGPDA